METKENLCKKGLILFKFLSTDYNSTLH